MGLSPSGRLHAEESQASLFDHSPGAHAAAIAQALDKNAPAQAYLHARAWRAATPTDAAPLTALATVYLAFQAPAAAVESLHAALNLSPPAAEVRRIHATIIQAQAEAGDYRAAWGQARAYLKTASSDDEFAPLLTRSQWHFYGRLFSEVGRAEIAARSALRPIDVPLTPAVFRTRGAALLRDAFNQFKAVESPDDAVAYNAATLAFARRALLAHYAVIPASGLADPEPLNNYPDLIQALRSVESAPPYVSALLTHSSYRDFDGNFRPDTLLDGDATDSSEVTPSSPLPAITNLFATLPPVWARLKTKLIAATATADSAKTLPAVEAAWLELQTLRDGPLLNLSDRVSQLSDQLHEWRDSLPNPALHADLATQLESWAETLRDDPSIAALHLRLTPAFPSSIVSLEDFELRLADGGILSVVTAELAVHSLPRRWATLHFAAAEADWSTPRQRLETVLAPALADFDAALARDLMTPALWAKREQAALRENASWAQLVWSAYEAHRSDDAALNAWFSPRLATNDDQLKIHLNALADDKVTQDFGALMDCLKRDPGNLSALETLYRFLAPNDEPAAVGILADFWALGPLDYTVTNEDLALALRTADWPLLLSLADHRLRANDADTDAHLHRQIAALALGLPGLVADSTTALDGTVYRHTTRLLHAMAHGLDKTAHTIYNDSQVGLRSSYELLGNDHDDPLIRLWLALALTAQQRTFSLANVKWDALENGASPALRTHFAFLRGELDPASHLARHRGTPEEATALFVQAIAGTLTGSVHSQDAARPAFIALADRPDLNILLRAAAAGAAANQRRFTPVPLRLDDPYYAAANTSAWPAVFAQLAPGQAIIAEGIIPLESSASASSILRLERSPRAPKLTISGKRLAPGPLWELTGVTFAGGTFDLHEGHLLALDQARINGLQLRGSGLVWAQATALDYSSFDLPQFAFTDVSSKKIQLVAHRRADLRRVQADQADFTLGTVAESSTRPDAASASISGSILIHRETTPLHLRPGARIHLNDSWLVAPGGLAASATSLTARDSRLITDSTSSASDISGLSRTTFNLTGPAQHQPQTPTELQAALTHARPGDRIELAAQDYLLESPVRVPDGVVLRGTSKGAKATTFSVKDTLFWSPVISVGSGSAWLENFTLKINKRTSVMGGRTVEMSDSKSDRQGLAVISSPVTVINNVGFADWNSYAPENRPALLAQASRLLVLGTAPSRVQVASGARIDLFSDPAYRTLNLRGDGIITSSYNTASALNVSGAGLDFRGATALPNALAYQKGAGDAQVRARRALAEENFNATVAAAGAQLSARLDAAPTVEARMAVFRSLALRLDPVTRAAQLTPAQVVAAYARHFNGALVARPSEFTSHFEALHFYRNTYSHNEWLLHLDTFPPQYRELLKVHLNALVASQSRRDGRLSGEDRSALIAFMQNFPPGHAEHSRAMDAYRLGTSYADFRNTLQAEADTRARNAAYAAQKVAAQARQQREWEAQQRARVADQSRPKSWWETYSAQYPNGRYNGAASTGGSADQQMRNYRHELNKSIYNAGRDYGKQRVY